MNYNNYTFTFLRSFVLYWLFPLLLVLTISLVYSLYFDTAHLCDDNGYSTLYQLKTKLTMEVKNYRISIVNYECYSDLLDQLKNNWPSNVKDSTREALLDTQIQNWQIRRTESLNKVRELEAAVKAIEPNFKLIHTYTNYDYSLFSPMRD